MFTIFKSLGNIRNFFHNVFSVFPKSIYEILASSPCIFVIIAR